MSEQLADLMGEGRLNYFAGVFAWGSLSTEQTLTSLHLFQTSVVPAVRRAVKSPFGSVSADET